MVIGNIKEEMVTKIDPSEVNTAKEITIYIDK